MPNQKISELLAIDAVSDSDLFAVVDDTVTKKATRAQVIATAEKTANKGVANGYASLGSDGKVPSSQLPSGGGNVTGPGTSVDGNLAAFSGTAGDTLTDAGIAASAVVLTTDARLSDARTPTSHNILSTAHGDTLADAVVRGDVIVGNSTPKWARLAKGAAKTVLRSDGTDVAYASKDTLCAEFTTTATGNVDDLDFSNADLIRFNNATDATLRGLKAGTAGQVVIVVSIGAGNVFLAHQNTNSAAANRLINFATAGTTPLAAGQGACVYQYDGSTARWRLISHIQGAFITPTFDAADYTGGGAQTWTLTSGDVNTFGYLLEGKILSLQLNLTNTTIGGTPDADLRRTMPNSFTVAKTVTSLYSFNNAGTTGVGEILFSSASNTIMTFRRAVLSGSTNWTGGTDNSDLRGVAKVEIN